MSNMAKILTINVTNKSGSTGKLIDYIENELRDSDYEFYHLYAYGEASNNSLKYCNKNELRINRNLFKITGNKFGIGKVQLFRIERFISTYEPDIVHVHCPNSHSVDLFGLISFLRRKCIKTVITLHAEFFYTGCCDHAYDCEKWKTGCYACENIVEANPTLFFHRTHDMWKRMKRCFDGFKSIRFVSVSAYVDNRLKQSAICGNYKHRIIHNGLDTNVFFDYGIFDDNNKKTVFHVSANFSDQPEDPKGGCFLIELAKRCPDIQFKVACSYKSIQKEIPSNIEILGNIEDQIQLARYYNQANLTIITSRRETFSMVCAESLCCGTPVIGFKAGGPESIALQEYSEFVDYKQIDDLEKILRKWIDHKTISNCKVISKSGKDRYSQRRMAIEYQEVYDELLKEGR